MAPPVDLSGVLVHLEAAKHNLEQALLALPTQDRMLQAHAYVFGHLRASQVVTDSALGFIRELEAYAKKSESKPSK